MKDRLQKDINAAVTAVEGISTVEINFGVMDEEQLHVPSSYTGEWLASLLFVNFNFFVDTFDTISYIFFRVYRQ